MAQISAVSGQDLDSFEPPAFQLLLGPAIIAVGVCSHAGSPLAIGLLPRQPERNDSPLDHVIHGLSWRIVIVSLVPIIYLLTITLVFALSPIATHIYPPHIVAMNILRSHYLWISIAIPCALLFGALVSGLCVWSLHWLAPRRIVSDVSVSTNADWSGRQDTIRHIVDDWQKLLLYPGFAQVFLLSLWFIPAFVDPFMDTSFGIIVTMAPLLLWGAWFLIPL